MRKDLTDALNTFTVILLAILSLHSVWFLVSILYFIILGIQEKLGILNGGRVSAVYDYEAQNADELTFRTGDELVILRKGDDFEREWWWSRISDHEGYIPRNLLGVSGRQRF